MTPVQIAYFKHFLFDMGIQAIYISMYKRNRIKGGPEGDKNGNPESLEQFLQEQPPFRVLMYAFYFQANSDFGYDYWKDINKKWEKYLKLHDDNPQNNKVVVLKGAFAILRQNWDSSQYWKIETMEATYKRMHMEPPLKGVDLEKAFYVPRSNHSEESQEEDREQHKFKVGDIIQGSISNEVLTITAITDKWYETNDGGVIDFDKEEFWDKIDKVAQEGEDNASGLIARGQAVYEDVCINEDYDDKSDFSRVPEAEEDKPDIEPLLDGFSLVDTENKHGGKKMKNNLVSVNLKNGGYRITFSSKESDNLRSHKYEYVQLLTKEKTGEVALKFNHNRGCNVNIKGSKQTETRNVVINSKDIVESIHKFYNLNKSVNYFILSIAATLQINNDTIYILKYEE